MIFISYTRDPLKVRARGELPHVDGTSTFTCDDHTTVTFKSGVLRAKGVDVDLEIFAIKTVAINSVE